MATLAFDLFVRIRGDSLAPAADEVPAQTQPSRPQLRVWLYQLRVVPPIAPIPRPVDG